MTPRRRAGHFPGRIPALAVALAVVLTLTLTLTVGAAQAQAPAAADDGDTGDLAARLGLADLAAYRAALAGRATADDERAARPPQPVSFRDLWDRPDAWRGLRVEVRGRIARTFRQDALGSFPPLVEAWLGEPSGDVLCVVFPAEPGAPAAWEREPGRAVAFTGTFLKTVRYAAADQDRLAPLIVGDRPPALVPRPAGDHPSSGSPAWPVSSPAWPGDFPAWPGGAWALGLGGALVLAVALAWRHVRTSPPLPPPRAGRAERPGSGSGLGLDSPLEFVDGGPSDGPAIPHA